MIFLALGKGDAEMVQVPGELVAPDLSRRAFLATRAQARGAVR